MDLIERYLAAIGRNLPNDQAGDIEAELRDLLLSRVEEQEAERGRALSRAELETLVIEFGHPLAVAGRYRPTQYLIGPEVFPFWWAALKIILGVVAAIFVTLAVLGLAAQHGGPDYERLFPPLWSSLCIVFTVVTLAAVSVERYGLDRLLKRWRPAQLPAPQAKIRSAFDRGLEMTANLVFILWWIGLIQFRQWIPDWNAIRLDMAPVWTQFHGWILGYLLAEMVLAVLALVRPGMVRLNGTLAILRYLSGAVIMASVLRAGHFVVVSSQDISGAALETTQRNFDKGFYAGIVVTIAMLLIQAMLEGWRMWRNVARAEGPPHAA